jgi:hypothetical protein
MRWSIGRTIVAIGALHEAVGLAGGLGVIPMPGVGRRSVVREIVDGGVIGAIEPDPVRQTFFWYFFFGLALLMLGGLLDRWEARGEPLPAALGWQILALALAGGFLIPASGFWLAVPPALWVLRQARRAAPAPAAS